MKFLRPKSLDGILHADPHGAVHAKHRAQRERRRLTAIMVPALPSQERRNFPPELRSDTLILDEDGQWRKTTAPEEFARFLRKLSRRCDYWWDETTRHGKPTRMKRRTARPIEDLVVSVAPWLSDWIAGHNRTCTSPLPALSEIRNTWFVELLELLCRRRYVHALSLHADTADIHLDVICSRQLDGVRIGTTANRTIGPWIVCVDRQLRAGARVSPAKRAAFERSIANYRRRYGDAQPLDMQLAQMLDAVADRVIGAELILLKKAYAERVPENEERYRILQLQHLELARGALEQQQAPMQPL